MEIVGGFSPARVEARHYCLIQKRRSLYFGYILLLLYLGCYGRHGEGSHGAVKPGRAGTFNLTSGQHLSLCGLPGLPGLPAAPTCSSKQGKAPLMKCLL